MTTVPNDPVSTPPEGEPSLDPGAPKPVEPGEEPKPGDEPFTRSRAVRGSGTRWLALAFFLAFLAVGTIIVVIAAEKS